MMRVLPVVALIACASTSEEPPGFQGGSFEVTTTNATDMCTGGGFEAIFLPDGSSQTWEVPWELPGVADLAWTHTVDMQDPFGEMQVTFEQGAQGEDWMQALGGAPPPEVEIDPTNAPGCFVDATVDTYLQIVDSNALIGSAIVHLTSLDEASCPATETELCDVKLDLRWQRL